MDHWRIIGEKTAAQFELPNLVARLTWPIVNVSLAACSERVANPVAQFEGNGASLGQFVLINQDRVRRLIISTSETYGLYY